MTSPDLLLRDAEDADKDGLVTLISGCFAEYEGCLFVIEELPELLAIATAFRDMKGRFWVAERAGRIVGSVGFSPGKKPGYAELKKLYVERSARRLGLGGTLCGLAEEASKKAGFAGMEMWSDTRFTTAHRFYEKRGYRRGEHTRFLHDLSHTEEYYFERLF